MTKLELTGDATLRNSQGGSWSIFNSTPGDPTTGYLKGHGFTLTVGGSGSIYLNGLGDTGLGDIIVNGSLGIQGSTGLGIESNTLTLNSSLTLWDTGSYGVLRKHFDLMSSSNITSGGSENFLAGNTLMEGIVNFNTATNLTLTGAITGSAGGLIKQSTGTLTLAGTQNFSGNTNIISGTLALSGSGTIGNVINSSTLEILDGNHTLGNVSGSNSTTVIDAGATLNVTSLVQDTLVMGAGATLNIAQISGGYQLASSASLTPVPEPGTWMLLATAFFAFFAFAMKRVKIRN